MEDDKLVPIDFTKISKFNWRHPDPRLAFFIKNLSIAGIQPTHISEFTSCDLKTIKKYYTPELEHGKACALGQLTAKAMEMALEEGNEKILMHMMKGLGFNSERQKFAKSAQEEETEKSTKKKVMMNTELLDREELKTLHKLLAKMNPIDMEPIQGEVIKKTEAE